MIARIVAAVLLLAALSGAVVTWLVYKGRISVPERDNPFLPLDVRAAPGLLTPWKFWRATHDPAECMTALESVPAAIGPVLDKLSFRWIRQSNLLR
jgi:hypothetical protein